MRPTTRDVGIRVMGILEALFDSPDSAFAKLPAAAVLSMTYNCSKVNEGLLTFSLQLPLNGDKVLVPINFKAVDMRVEAHGRVVLGFLTNVRAVLEFGVSSLETSSTAEYDAVDLQKMAQDIMFHLCS